MTLGRTADVTSSLRRDAHLREEMRIRSGRIAGLCVLVGYFLLLAIATTTSALELRDVAMLLVVYGLLSTMLGAIALASASAGRIGGLLGSLPLAVAAVSHLREQTSHLADHSLFFIAVSLLAIACSELARRLRPREPIGWIRGAATVGGVAALFLVVTSGFYLSSNTFRWHLLRHNKLIGTVFYYLLADPVSEIEAKVWKAHVNPQLVPEPADSIGHGGAVGPNRDAPNIIFVLIDTLRADQLAPYGASPDVMSNLNRLAERSFVFDDVIANAVWTRPSVASFFTGLPEELHGAVDRNHALPLDRHTLAEVLHEAGFETSAFVSNFGAVGREAGFAQGFEHFEEVKDGDMPYARAEIVNRAVEQWLAKRAGGGGAPVFLYIHYLDPHTPYLSGCGGECPSSTRAEALQSYQKQLRYLDSQLRWVLEDLPALLGRRTILLVTSDHGEEFGEHGEGGHGHSLYREVLHVPAILHVGASSGSRIDEKLEASDFFDLITRVAADPGFEVSAWAKSRTRSVRYASLDSTSEHAIHRPYQGRVFMRGLERDGQLLIWSAYGDTRELYDLAKDPSERVNLARARSSQVESMTQEMERYIPQWVARVTLIPSEENVKALHAMGYIK